MTEWRSLHFANTQGNNTQHLMLWYDCEWRSLHFANTQGNDMQQLMLWFDYEWRSLHFANTHGNNMHQLMLWYDYEWRSLHFANTQGNCTQQLMLWYDIGFNHGLPCYVKNMARGTRVDKNQGRRLRFLSWLRPEGHVFNIAWQAMIKTYYSMTPFMI